LPCLSILDDGDDVGCVIGGAKRDRTADLLVANSTGSENEGSLWWKLVPKAAITTTIAGISTSVQYTVNPSRGIQFWGWLRHKPRHKRVIAVPLRFNLDTRFDPIHDYCQGLTRCRREVALQEG
jgi:hypothetical protein